MPSSLCKTVNTTFNYQKHNLFNFKLEGNTNSFRCMQYYYLKSTLWKMSICSNENIRIKQTWMDQLKF